MIRELYEATLNYLAETTINKHFRSVCEKRPIMGWVLALVFMTLWFESSLIPYVKSTLANINVPQEGQAALSLTGQQTNLPIQTSMATSTGGSEYVIFTGMWKPDNKEAYSQNGSEIFLHDGETGVRFDQTLPVDFGQRFRYIFSLGGKNGGNLQIGRFGSYEITVGDGDFKTIVIRDGDGNLVSESSGLNKIKLSKEILRDVSSELIVNEEILSEREFRLTIKINQEQPLIYNINLPTKWKEQDDIYFALLDLSGGENKTRVYWSEPEIGKNINN